MDKKSGANDRSRTDDLFITNELLYQLSYIGLSKEGVFTKNRREGQPAFENKTAYSREPTRMTLPARRLNPLIHIPDDSHADIPVYADQRSPAVPGCPSTLFYSSDSELSCRLRSCQREGVANCGYAPPVSDISSTVVQSQPSM